MKTVLREAPTPAYLHIHGWKHIWRKRVITWSRWLHIYLSMVSFAILFFFAVTGLTANHVEWFTNQQKTFEYKGTMPRAWLRPTDGKELARLEIVEQLRKAHGIRAAMNDFRVDDAQIAVSFKGPGYTADTFIDREKGTYEITETRMGWGAILNDLHKGRDTGATWKLLIDASAIFMALVSATGIALILFLAKRRFSGLLAAAIGAALCYVVYSAWVP